MEKAMDENTPKKSNSDLSGDKEEELNDNSTSEIPNKPEEEEKETNVDQTYDPKINQSVSNNSMEINEEMGNIGEGIKPIEINKISERRYVNIDHEIPMIPEEGVNANTRFLKSGIPDRISERIPAPIYKIDDLEEEFDLNKRMSFGIND